MCILGRSWGRSDFSVHRRVRNLGPQNMRKQRIWKVWGEGKQERGNISRVEIQPRKYFQGEHYLRGLCHCSKDRMGSVLSIFLTHPQHSHADQHCFVHRSLLGPQGGWVPRTSWHGENLSPHVWDTKARVWRRHDMLGTSLYFFFLPKIESYILFYCIYPWGTIFWTSVMSINTFLSTSDFIGISEFHCGKFM